jgi:hypothetical protein
MKLRSNLILGILAGGAALALGVLEGCSSKSDKAKAEPQKEEVAESTAAAPEGREDLDNNATASAGEDADDNTTTASAGDGNNEGAVASNDGEEGGDKEPLKNAVASAAAAVLNKAVGEKGTEEKA